MISQINKIVLKSLATGDKYGLEIIKDIEQFTNGKVVLKQPTLYSSLRRMEKKGYISSFWEDSEIGGRRHYYSLTQAGKNELTADDSLSESDIQSILAEVNGQKRTSQPQAPVQPIVKNKTAFEKFDPSTESINAQSFTQQVRKDSKPIELSEKTPVKAKEISTNIENSQQNPSQQAKEDSPYWRETIKNEEQNAQSTEFKLNDEAKSNRFEINYKDILGDLDADTSPEVEAPITPPQPVQSKSKVQRNEPQGNVYTRQVSDIFSQSAGNNYKQQKEQDIKEAIFKQQNQSTLEEIQRRYNLNGINNSDSTKYEDFTYQNSTNTSRSIHNHVDIKEYDKKSTEISNSEKEFLCVNKLNLTRSIIMTFFYIMAVLISYFVFKEQSLIYSPHEFTYWLYIGLAGLYLIIMLTVTLTHFNKKVQIKKINWLSNLFYRFLLAVVLFIFVIALCLCFGMTNFLQIEFFTLWYLPTLAIGSILVSWLVGLIVFSTRKFRA